MSRETKQACSLLLIAVVVLSGCTPKQPYYLNEDGDLSHYLDSATEIEYPDVESHGLADTKQTLQPRTISNPDFDEIWDLRLEEAVQIALKNSKVIRKFAQVETITAPTELRATIQGSGNNVDAGVASVYDPALQESSPGGSQVRSPFVTQQSLGQTSLGAGIAGDSTTLAPEHPTGVEAALSDFDARFATEFFWSRTDRPLNNDLQAVRQRDLANINMQISKLAADGTKFFARNRTIYDEDSGFGFPQPLSSFWETAFEFEVRRPLLRGAGTQVNRSGVQLARINTDISLADFEADVRDLVNDVERAYWTLYRAYRFLEADKVGRDSALITWKHTKALQEGGEALREDVAQAQEQYFFFRAQVEDSLRNVFQAESNLRYLMGIAATDKRLIRPADEPTRARIKFDWSDILTESLVRSVEIRKQKWRIKQRETQLIVARNRVLPRLDAVGMYRFLGLGDQLLQENRVGVNFPDPNSQAFDELTEGDYQEWTLGLQMEIPIGFRQELAGVRYYQLQMAKAKAVLDDLELEISHQLTSSVRRLDTAYQVTQTNLNRRAAAKTAVDLIRNAYEDRRSATQTLNDLLTLQRRQAEAEKAYYQALVDYNLALLEIHYRKGSLLEYNGVFLAEGPWPAKAYYDAHARARRRDASYYLDYGFTRPGVISRGPYQQRTGHGPHTPGHGPMTAPIEGPIQGLPHPGQTHPGQQPAAPEPVDQSPVPAPAPLTAAAETVDGVQPAAAVTSAPGKVRRASATSDSTNSSGSTKKFDWGTLGLPQSSTQKESGVTVTVRPANEAPQPAADAPAAP